MLRFSFNVVNADKLEIAFRGLTDQIQDWREVWPRVSGKLTEIEEQLFNSAGATGEHGRWADLKPSYARAKERKWGQAPPLQASGHLRNALGGQSSEGIDMRQPLLLRWGTEVPYAVFHQTGTRKMPARPIFDLTVEDREVMRATIEREAARFSGRLGFAVASELGGNARPAREPGVAAINAGGVPLSEGF